MKSTDLTYPIPLSNPIAYNGTRNEIPTTATGSNYASVEEGFPDVTMISPADGGLPPWGQDMNGMLYLMSDLKPFLQSGGFITFNQEVSDQIGGYPKDAILGYVNSQGIYQQVRSLIDDNTYNFVDNPDYIDDEHWESLQTQNVNWGNISGDLEDQTDLQTALDDEKSARESADTDLQTALDNEKSARESADTDLQTALDNEKSARESADSDLDSRVDTLEQTVNTDISELQSDVATIQNNYVTTNTSQTVSAMKYFSGGMVTGTSTTSGVYLKPEAGIELFSTNSSNGGYIDFHYAGSTSDYTSRIIEGSSGVISVNGGFAVSSTLAVSSSTTLSGALSVSGQTTHSGTTIFNNTITTNGTANLASTVNITGTTSHSGTTTFNNSVNCNSTTTLSGTNTISGATTFSNSSVLRSSSLSASDSSTQIPTTAWVNSRITSIMDSDGGAMLNPDYSSITSIETGYVAPSSGIVYLTQSLGNVTTSVAVNDTTVLTMKGHSGSSHGQPQPCATVILGSGDTVTFANTSSSYFVPFG